MPPAELVCPALVFAIALGLGLWAGAPERRDDRAKRRAHDQIIEAGWCHHHAATVAYGCAPPEPKQPCCERNTTDDTAA